MSASTDRTHLTWPGSKWEPGVTRSHGVTRHLISPGQIQRVIDSCQALSCMVRSAGYYQMMSSKINTQYNSIFQSKLRLFQSLETHGIRSTAEVITLLLAHSDPFYSRRIHLVPRSFLRYLAGGWSQAGLWSIVSSRTMCYQCYSGHYRDTEERLASASVTIVWQYRLWPAGVRN